MADLIRVKAAEPTKVALWEQHKDHPDGEAFVAGAGVQTVARTAEVQKRIGDGRLIELRDAPADAGDAGANGSPAGGAAGDQASGQPSSQQSAPPPTFQERLTAAVGGNGETAAQLMMAGFSTPEAIQAASDDALDAVPGVGSALVTKLREAFPAA